ncbi:MAG: hypothetical protein HQK99_15015 [Nitrospirae bacterium]|nr:hypothetical protein [Nitrospirota bacterium]
MTKVLDKTDKIHIHYQKCPTFYPVKRGLERFIMKEEDTVEDIIVTN